MINFNINNLSSTKKLDLNTKNLKIRQDVGDKIKSPTNGKIIDVDDKTCGGQVTISFQYEKSEYTMEMCGIIYRNFRGKNSKVLVGEQIGVSTGQPLYISVSDYRNRPVKLSLFGEKKSTKDSYDSNSEATLFDAIIHSISNSFKSKPAGSMSLSCNAAMASL